MTAALLTTAFAMTLADIGAYIVLIVPGFVAERNPLILTISSPSAVLARLLLLVVLAALAVAEDGAGGSAGGWPFNVHVVPALAVTIVVRLALAAATVIGLLGAVATVGSL